MEIICFKIPSNLKEKMKEINIDWENEIKQFVREKIREYEIKKAREELQMLYEEFMKTNQKL